MHSNLIDDLICSLSQVFGKTPEGKKDDRVISAFATEIAALYEATQQKFPLIIVASAEETDVPAELQRMFTETIHMTPLDEEKRVHLTLSLLQVKRCIVDTDLYLPLALERCTDFRYEDLQALVLNAIKAQVRSIPRNRQFTILQKDFNCASGTNKKSNNAQTLNNLPAFLVRHTTQRKLIQVARFFIFHALK